MWLAWRRLTLGFLRQEVEGAGLGAQVLAGAVDPHVGGEHLVGGLLEVQVAVQHPLVRCRVLVGASHAATRATARSHTRHAPSTRQEHGHTQYCGGTYIKIAHFTRHAIAINLLFLV